MQNKIIEDHFSELVKMSGLLKTLVDSYRLLIASASDINTIAIRRTKDVEKAIDRADEVGKLIDEIVKIMDDYEHCYIKYSKVKNEIVSLTYEKKKLKNELTDVIQTEIDKELNFFNNVGLNKRDEDEERDEKKTDKK
ncbi:MAG: hypothetical protein KIB43_12035 [Clostridium baratii]|uniref:Uncharacterized protein n=1 Tax=Clostridium baratii str. Sullivan TaxID=1415775 RepID=A0A0A7FV69_9CLOT|nr:hypothetical protein [Clostridium baratii]AIY83539.1 hypothetical protein U729_365 [Clostridium baratii str. Sullivan]MBS6007676.1 hypothetical protein [Clostridium baratii]MDU1054468.1 hypothetical protein [Clostridium baratii]MDU4911554.1 hypothetical protein [Clostridium baratii]CUP59472.1 Uncharacterised protein [Clostridium baratii]